MPSILTFPSIQASSLDFFLNALTRTFTSEFSGVVQTEELPGAYWEAVMTFENRNDSSTRELLAFLDSLSGSAGRFYLWNMAQESPLGIGTGTPKVKGADQPAGKSLITDGWTPNTTGILLKGDLFSVGYELKRLTANANSNADGDSTLVFTPALRSSPADNADLKVTKATCVMMLIDGRQAIAKYRPKPVADIVVQCREMWPVA